MQSAVVKEKAMGRTYRRDLLYASGCDTSLAPLLSLDRSLFHETEVLSITTASVKPMLEQAIPYVCIKSI